MTFNFSRAILHWFDLHGRKNLPWQKNKTPYRVWISEIMLQQTQVATVIPYFLKFIERFPDVKTLAQASLDEVLHLWTGLGYYSRARNLHRTAKIIHEKFFDEFPASLSELENFPGIGRSTAAAILALAFEKKATILDGNVKRVLARFYAIETWTGEKSTTELLWSHAKKLTPKKRIADYTQAMMDLGATLCVRGKPLCSACPLQKKCSAHELGLEKKLPIAKPKKSLPVKNTVLLLLKKNNFVLLQKRPAKGIWAGLWSLPENATPLAREIKNRCQEFSCEMISQKKLKSFRHTFTHFHLDILPIEVLVKQKKSVAHENYLWYNPQKPAAIGLPAPIKMLLNFSLENSKFPAKINLES